MICEISKSDSKVDVLENTHLFGMNRILSSGFTLNKILSAGGNTFKSNGREYIDFASGAYLGVNKDITIQDLYRLKKWGIRSPFSRISGLQQPQFELEESISSELGFYQTITAQSISLINLNIFISLKKIFQEFIIDEDAHSTLYSGLKAAKSSAIKFNNNDLYSLEEKLINSGSYRKLIIIDGLYSMSGAIAPLKEMLVLAKKYNAYILIDDAHGFGVLGESGLGILEHLGLIGQENLIYIGGFSKAYSNPLGFVCIPKELDLLFRASFNATTFSGPPCNLNYIISNRHMKNRRKSKYLLKRNKLNSNISYCRNELKSLGVKLASNDHSAIIALRINTNYFEELSRDLHSSSIYIKPAIFPIVAEGKEIIRITITEKHTVMNLDKLIKFVSDNMRYFYYE